MIESFDAQDLRMKINRVFGREEHYHFSRLGIQHIEMLAICQLHLSHAHSLEKRSLPPV